MAAGIYAGGDPWTYAEQRQCVGWDDKGCDQILCDILDASGQERTGTFSPRCIPCRDKRRSAQQRDAPSHKYKRKRPQRRENVPEAVKENRPKTAAVWKAALIHVIEEEGVSVGEAAARLGRSTSAVERHRDRDAAFAARLEAAKLSARSGPIDRQGTLTFGEFSAKYFDRTHYAHQLRIAEEIDRLNPRDVAMVLAWPESGKTATIEDWINRTLALDPTHRIRIISESQDLAIRIVGACSRRFRELDDYAAFIGRYGPFYEKGQERAYAKPWTSNQITLWKNPGKERDRNLVAQSWSGANYGSRIDTLIIDDVISQRNVNQSQEIFERIRGTFFNRGVEMRTIIVGTRIKPGDFYDKMDDAGLITRHLYVPVVGGLGAEPGEPTTPKMWEHRLRHDGSSCCPPGMERKCPKNGEWLSPLEFLDLLKFQSGEQTWWASYMQNPRDDAVSTFGANIEACKDLARTVGPAGNGLNVCSIDPALGGGTALVAANISHDKLSILDAYTVRGLARTEEQIDLIRHFAEKYRPIVFVIEFDAQQKGLGNDERVRDLGRRMGFQVVPHITRGQKFDVPYNVASMNQSFIRHEISIPWSGDETQRRLADLEYQLRGWRIPPIDEMTGRPKKDRQVQDLVMALWFIWRYWMQHRSAPTGQYAPAKRPSWIPHDPRRHRHMSARP